MWNVTVPNQVFEKLIGGYNSEAARDLLEQRARGSFLNPGSPYGEVLAWLWQTDSAVACVVDLLANIRYHMVGADKTITLDALIEGLQFAVHDMPASEADALMARLRADVPASFDTDITSQPGVGQRLYPASSGANFRPWRRSPDL